MGLDSLLLGEAVKLRRPSLGSWWQLFSMCPVRVVRGLSTHVSLPRVLESSLAKENNWWIFLFRDALFPFLISSLILWHQVLISAHKFSELTIVIEIPFLSSSRGCIATSAYCIAKPSAYCIAGTKHVHLQWGKCEAKEPFSILCSCGHAAEVRVFIRKYISQIYLLWLKGVLVAYLKKSD